MSKKIRLSLLQNIWRSTLQSANYCNQNRQNKKNYVPLFQIFCGAAVASAITTAIYTYTKLDRKSFKLRNFTAESDLRDKFNFINKVVEKCAPAVVYVEIKDPRRIDKGTDDSLIVSNGSGFIIREDGWILTNAHVVINKPNAIIHVKLYDGTTYKATVEDADMNIDLALIKINSDRQLPALNLAKTGDVNVGEWVVALGSPLSLSHSATAGVVSCVNRSADELGLKNYQMKYIQTDAPITFGNSGGPLVNLDGEVIGINNLRITAGISFAIPIEYVSKFLDRVNQDSARKKEPQEKDLGITILSMSADMLKDKNVTGKETGVFVWKVMADSPAEKSGLQIGDIITHVNDRPITNSSDLYKFFKNYSQISIDVIRNGKQLKLIIQK